MPVWHHAYVVWLEQRGALFPWVPVAMACGIAVYFNLRIEPAALTYIWLGAGGGCALLMLRVAPANLTPMIWALVLAIVGFCLAGLRAHQVEEPVLGWRYYGPV